MPIKPENKARYPKNWSTEIRPRILARAGNCCEGSPAYPDCRIPNGWARNNRTGEVCAPDDPYSDAWLADGDSVTTAVLTIGHLDHQPENCADENLMAWCNRCHLTYDARHHAQSAYMTRRLGKALRDLL